MKKRVLAAVLWAGFGWYVGAAAAWVLGLGPVLPIALAVAAGSIFAADPRRIIWSRTDQRSQG